MEQASCLVYLLQQCINISTVKVQNSPFVPFLQHCQSVKEHKNGMHSTLQHKIWLLFEGPNNYFRKNCDFWVTLLLSNSFYVDVFIISYRCFVILGLAIILATFPKNREFFQFSGHTVLNKVIKKHLR